MIQRSCERGSRRRCAISSRPLAGEGVTPFSTTGLPLDSGVAEAVATRPAEGVPDETMLEQTQRGYRIGDRPLRPAQVVVAKNA
jgi:molecular chaperone GrpE